MLRAAPRAAGDILCVSAGAKRIVRIRRALPYRRDIEAENSGGQKAHIGQNRKAAADAGVMIEEAHALRFEKIAQTVLAARDARLGEPEDHLGGTGPQAGFLERAQDRDGLHQGLAGAARFGDRHEPRGGQRQPVQDVVEGDGVEIVEEMHARARR